MTVAMPPANPSSRREVFVYASNFLGRMEKGSARRARQEFGASGKKAYGMTGDAFAIPTRGHDLKLLPIEKIERYVRKFIAHAATTPDVVYLVQRLAVGDNAYKPQEIAVLFKDAPANCVLPDGWRIMASGRPWEPPVRIASVALKSRRRVIVAHRRTAKPHETIRTPKASQSAHLPEFQPDPSPTTRSKP